MNKTKPDKTYFYLYTYYLQASLTKHYFLDIDLFLHTAYLVSLNNKKTS